MKINLISLVLAVALAISAASLFATLNVSASGVKPDSTCQVWEYDTTCKYTCVPDSPNGCGTAQWSYYCSRKVLKIYATGQYVSSGYVPPAIYCDANTNCYSTCTASLPPP